MAHRRGHKSKAYYEGYKIGGLKIHPDNIAIQSWEYRSNPKSVREFWEGFRIAKTRAKSKKEKKELIRHEMRMIFPTDHEEVIKYLESKWWYEKAILSNIKGA